MLCVKCHHDLEGSPLSVFCPETELSLHRRAGTARAVCCLAAGPKFMVMVWVIGQGHEGGGHC